MEQNISLILKHVISTIWRQRILLFVPLMIMLPLSILGAKYLPKTYIATALMVMQESNRDNPFIKSGDVDLSLVERIKGLETWLKSDHVMSQILQQFTQTDPVQSPAAFTIELEDMREAFKLELVGNDFLKFSLKDGNPKGLGDKLQAITARFLEGLLVADTAVVSSSQVVLQSLKRKLETAKQLQNDLLKQFEDSVVELDNQTNKNDIPKKMKETGAQQRGDGISQKARIISALEESESSPGFPLQQLAQNGSQRVLGGGSSSELDELREKIRIIDRKVAEAQRNLDRSKNNLAAVNVQNPLGILKAPEGIKIIDPPKDPARPATSGLKIFLAGIVSAVFFGIGLATMAEILDQRVRTRDDFAAITGTRIIGRLSCLEGFEPDNPGNEPTLRQSG